MPLVRARPQHHPQRTMRLLLSRVLKPNRLFAHTPMTASVMSQRTAPTARIRQIVKRLRRQNPDKPLAHLRNHNHPPRPARRVLIRAGMPTTVYATSPHTANSARIQRTAAFQPQCGKAALRALGVVLPVPVSHLHHSRHRTKLPRRPDLIAVDGRTMVNVMSRHTVHLVQTLPIARRLKPKLLHRLSLIHI